jgi:hypothetical protein
MVSQSRNMLTCTGLIENGWSYKLSLRHEKIRVILHTTVMVAFLYECVCEILHDLMTLQNKSPAFSLQKLSSNFSSLSSAKLLKRKLMFIREASDMEINI